MPRGNIVDAAEQLGELDYMQLMADMEQSFMDSMLQDEAAFLSQLEAQEVASLVSPSHAWLRLSMLGWANKRRWLKRVIWVRRCIWKEEFGKVMSRLESSLPLLTLKELRSRAAWLVNTSCPGLMFIA